MITYDPDKNQSLLQLLWIHQNDKMMEMEALKIVTCLINILAEDMGIMEYFSNLPPVTYQYARYTDWIKPFLEKVANGGVSSKKEKATMAISKLHAYETYLNNKDGGSNASGEEQKTQASTNSSS